jgi:Bacteriophage tail sheath protein
MATAPTYPGVYIEEVPSGVHTITGVATSITAFAGYAPRGPANDPTLVQSFTEYTRVFGGLSSLSTMSYAVQQFFANGGRDALIVRVVHLSGDGGATPASKGTATIGTNPDDLGLEAANEGGWSQNLKARVDYETSDKDSGSPTLFNLLVKDESTGVIETLRNLAPNASLPAIIAQQSNLVRVTNVPDARPAKHADINPGEDPFDPAHTDRYDVFSAGDDGDQAEDDVIPAADDGTGVYALAKADLFNLLVIPPFKTGAGNAVTSAAKGRAAAFCQDHRALFLVDPDPTWDDPSDLTSSGAYATYIQGIASDARKNAAIYFPYVRNPDPEQGDAIVEFPPSGAVAGVMARTDATRGVWKAPAGLDAGLAVLDLKAKLTDDQNGILNPLGVNCLRIFPAAGNVVWGARTLAGNDALASEWKYVPVRRLALYLEESLFRGTQWVVFEPNDEPLWSQIRLNVGAFMQNLFRQGAFQGQSPRDAYFVKCDSETTTQNDIDLGIVNILVGFAPLKPAEFVIIRIQQIAGQVAA